MVAALGKTITMMIFLWFASDTSSHEHICDLTDLAIYYIDRGGDAAEPTGPTPPLASPAHVFFSLTILYRNCQDLYRKEMLSSASRDADPGTTAGKRARVRARVPRHPARPSSPD